jgi:fructose-1,6-bisphosphatase/inositol monophosphatase family enzyme
MTKVHLNFLTEKSERFKRLTVRSMSGSPAWGILEASKGFTTYINMWDSRSTELYDLIAAVRIIRGAGGNIVDSKGNPISETDHTGLFIAGIHQEQIEKVLQLI